MLDHQRLLDKLSNFGIGDTQTYFIARPYAVRIGWGCSEFFRVSSELRPWANPLIIHTRLVIHLLIVSHLWKIGILFNDNFTFRGHLNRSTKGRLELRGSSNECLSILNKPVLLFICIKRFFFHCLPTVLQFDHLITNSPTLRNWKGFNACFSGTLPLNLQVLCPIYWPWLF